MLNMGNIKVTLILVLTLVVYNCSIVFGNAVEEDCIDNICVGVANGGFVNNPVSCSAFFQCIDGRVRRGNCPDGLVFNPIEMLCDDTEHYPCEDDPENPGEEPDIECIPYEAPLDFECRSNELTTAQHPSDCNKYIVCHHSIPIVRRCDTDLHWNTVHQHCMLPYLANCVLPICPFRDEPEKLIILPNEENCNSFFVCYNGEAIPHNCSTEFHWSVTEQLCTTPERALCNESYIPPVSEIECNPDIEGPFFEPHPTRCDLYFLCINGESHIRNCADGLIFDIIEGNCNIPENSTCIVDIEGRRSSPTVRLNSKIAKKTDNRKDDINLDQQCAEAGRDIIAHPERCDVFIGCHPNGALLLPCTPGLIFVEKRMACVAGNVETCIPG